MSTPRADSGVVVQYGQAASSSAGSAYMEHDTVSPTLPFPLSDRDAPTAGDTVSNHGRTTRLARMGRSRGRQICRDVG